MSKLPTVRFPRIERIDLNAMLRHGATSYHHAQGYDDYQHNALGALQFSYQGSAIRSNRQPLRVITRFLGCVLRINACALTMS